MGLEPRATFAALFASISQHIEDLASQHKLRVLILLDEAHLLPLQVLDQLHILLLCRVPSNAEFRRATLKFMRVFSV